MPLQLEPEYQEQLLALVPKFTASVGLPSCILLMSEVVLAHLKGDRSGGNPILRSLACVAFYQSLDALGWFLSTWAIPKGTFAFSAGNTQTCDFQGFLLQVVIGAPLFSMAMAWYFWLIVFCGKTAQELLVYERWVTPIIFIYSFGSGFILLAKQLYNPNGAVCWVQGYPSGCGNSIFQGSGEVPCERGDWAWLYGMLTFYMLLWICIFFIVCFNLSNYFTLRGDNDKEEATWFANQSFFFALAFVISWAPSTTWSALSWTADGSYFFVDIMAAFFEPLGGFWNLLIFLHSRPASRRRIMRLICLECWDKNDEGHDEIDKHGPPPPPPAPLIAKAPEGSQSRRSSRASRPGGSVMGGSRKDASSVVAAAAAAAISEEDEEDFSDGDELDDDDDDQVVTQKRPLQSSRQGKGTTAAEGA